MAITTRRAPSMWCRRRGSCTRRLPRSRTRTTRRRSLSGPRRSIPPRREPVKLSKDEWKKKLPAESFHVMREEGTERAGTSPLNNEKRAGIFACAGCGLPVFTSEMKFESGTGWPSFFTTIPGVFETKKDYYLIYPRVEYHCIRCGGHHGH